MRVEILTILAGLFLDAFILNRIPSSDPDALPSAYLAQSDILDNQSIIDDIPPLPHFKSGPQSTVYRRTMWIGPAGSFTPFHRDPYIGIYSQGKLQSCVDLYRQNGQANNNLLTKDELTCSSVVGRKTFHVLPPPALLNPSTDPQHGNTSTIPLPVSHFYPNPPDTHPNTKPFPLETDDIPAPIIVHGKTNLDQAFQLDGACRVDLDEGESVLVPEGWWHSAEGGTSPGVGVGAWFT